MALSPLAACTLLRCACHHAAQATWGLQAPSRSSSCSSPACWPPPTQPIVQLKPCAPRSCMQGVMKAINVNKLTSTGCTFKFWVADWFAQLNNKMGGDLKKIQTVGKYMVEVRHHEVHARHTHGSMSMLDQCRGSGSTSCACAEHIALLCASPACACVPVHINCGSQVPALSMKAIELQQRRNITVSPACGTVSCSWCVLAPGVEGSGHGPHPC